MSMDAPKIPVDVVFRIGNNPFAGAMSGALMANVMDAFATPPINALMPYERIGNAGWTQQGMVRCYTDHAGQKEETAVEWTTIIRDTKPAEPHQYDALMQSLNEHGFDVTPILATQVNTDRRTKIHSNPDPRDDVQSDEDLFGDSSQDADDEIVVEDVVIDFDIVNDDVGSGFLDPEKWA